MVMNNLVVLAQVLLIFAIISSVSVYVLSIVETVIGGSTNATNFITQAYSMYNILGQFGQVIVVVAVVSILIGMLGVRMGAQG
jgi:hypothetical protein